MAKTNTERQQAWRKRAQEARDYQREHQSRYTPPPGFMLIRQSLYEQMEAELAMQEVLQKVPCR
jgi:hypothetical protein